MRARRRRPGRGRYRLRGDRPLGHRLRLARRPRAAGGRLPKRRARRRRQGAYAVSERAAGGRGRPRLLGPEPGPQLRPAGGGRAALVLRRRRAAARAPAPASSRDARVDRAARRAARRTTRWRRWWWRRRCPATTRWPGARSRPASTCSSRSRWPGRRPRRASWRRWPPSGGATLMVGHLLRFHPGVVKLRELIDAGELGDVLYVYGNRQNLGVIREDENALWSLGVHDISVVLYLLGGRPVEVSARGECYLQPGVEDIVFGYVRAGRRPGRPPAPVAGSTRTRCGKMTVVGSKRMAVFDDMEADRKVTVYDKGPMEIAPRQDHRPTPATSRSPPSHARSRCGSSAARFVEAVRVGRSRPPGQRRRGRGGGGGAGGDAALARGRAARPSRSRACGHELDGGRRTGPDAGRGRGRSATTSASAPT